MNVIKQGWVGIFLLSGVLAQANFTVECKNLVEEFSVQQTSDQLNVNWNALNTDALTVLGSELFKQDGNWDRLSLNFRVGQKHFCESRELSEALPILKCTVNSYDHEIVQFKDSKAGRDLYWRGPAFALDTRRVEQIAPEGLETELQFEVIFYKDARRTVRFPKKDCSWTIQVEK